MTVSEENEGLMLKNARRDVKSELKKKQLEGVVSYTSSNSQMTEKVVPKT
jgi:hypothetical protein